MAWFFGWKESANVGVSGIPMSCFLGASYIPTHSLTIFTNLMFVFFIFIFVRLEMESLL
jgi:hypothetical protein